MRAQAAAIIYRRVAADKHIGEYGSGIPFQTEAPVMIACGITGEGYIGKFGITCIVIVHPAAVVVGMVIQECNIVKCRAALPSKQSGAILIGMVPCKRHVIQYGAASVVCVHTAAAASCAVVNEQYVIQFGSALVVVDTAAGAVCFIAFKNNIYKHGIAI